MKYRIKPSLRVFDLRKSNGTVVIGKNLPLSVTIEDASNQFVEMLKLLNGELHVENIAQRERIDATTARGYFERALQEAERRGVTPREVAEPLALRRFALVQQAAAHPSVRGAECCPPP